MATSYHSLPPVEQTKWKLIPSARSDLPRPEGIGVVFAILAIAVGMLLPVIASFGH